MSTNGPSEFVCVVCAEGASAAMSAECNWCDGRYHLNQRNDVEGKDCGQVWIDEQYLALQFACNACLAGTERDPAAGAQAGAVTPTPARAAARQRRYKRRA